MVVCIGLGLTIPTSVEDHAIYISVTKINHAADQPTATMNMRVFSDDLKSVLRNKYGFEAISDKATFCEDYETQMNQYFAKNLICHINQEEVSYYLSKCERLEEVFQLEFTMTCPQKWKTLKIDAPYFMELFPKQSNIVHIESGTKKRMGRTTKGNQLFQIRL